MVSFNKFCLPLFSLVLLALSHQGNATAQPPYGYNSSDQRTLSYGRFELRKSDSCALSGSVCVKEPDKITSNVIENLDTWRCLDKVVKEELEKEQQDGTHPSVFLTINFRYELTEDAVLALKEKLDSLQKWVRIDYSWPNMDPDNPKWQWGGVE
jgi:hypothetical protein